MRLFVDESGGGGRRSLRAVDLYAGAGGLSLGLKLGGIAVEAAVEIDEWAGETYRHNFPETHLSVARVSDLPEAFFERFALVDIVAGGPPCQGFSVSAGARRKENDERNSEVLHFVRAALRLRPRMILMENVAAMPRFALPSRELLINVVIRMLTEAGYATASFTVDAADFGIPQHRQRFFLIASQAGLPDLAAHRVCGPPGSGMRPWLTALDAIGDLPPINPGEIGEEDCLNYLIGPLNEYQRGLRAERGIFWNHVPMRHSRRLVERFAAIPPGGNGASVWSEHPARKRGKGDAQGVRFDQNHRRMDPDSPAPTITAYMYSTCLHPMQHRNLTVREAARLQTFPDRFRFMGKRTTLSTKLLERKGLFGDMGLNQLNQVGNAVPPTLGRVIARALTRVLAE